MIAWIMSQQIFSAMAVWPGHSLDHSTLQTRQPLPGWELCQDMSSNQLKFRCSVAKNIGYWMTYGARGTGDLEPVLGLSPNPPLASCVCNYTQRSGLKEDQGRWNLDRNLRISTEIVYPLLHFKLPSGRDASGLRGVISSQAEVKRLRVNPSLKKWSHQRVGWPHNR